MTALPLKSWRPEPCNLWLGDPYERLAGRIRELRIDAEMTQGELARRCGVERPHVCRWERALHTLFPTTLACIAAALEVDMDTLCCVLDERWVASARVIERAARERPPRVAARRAA